MSEVGTLKSKVIPIVASTSLPKNIIVEAPTTVYDPYLHPQNLLFELSAPGRFLSTVIAAWQSIPPTSTEGVNMPMDHTKKVSGLCIGGLFVAWVANFANVCQDVEIEKECYHCVPLMIK